MGEGPKDLRDDRLRERREGNSGRDDITGRPLTDLDRPGTETVVGYAGGSAPAVPSSAARGSDSPKTASIRSEIEQTRANIGETVEEIQQRLAPSNLVAEAKDTVREATRQRIRRVGSAAVDTASQVVDSSRRIANQAADTTRRVANQAADTTRRVASQAADTTRELADQAATTTRRLANEAAVRGRRVANQAVGAARENPLATAAAIGGIGAAAWWLMSRRGQDRDYVDMRDIDDIDELDDQYGEESLYYDEIEYDTRRTRLIDTVRGSSIPLVVAGLGVGYWLWSRQAGQRVRYVSGYGPESLEAGWTDPGEYGVDAGSYQSFDETTGQWRREVANRAERVRSTVSQAADRARDAVGDVSERARDVANRASEQVVVVSRRAKSQLEYWMDRNPLAVGAAAMAVGVAVGMAIPESRPERRVLGRARDRFVGNAKQYAGDAIGRAKQKAQEVASKATEEFKKPTNQ
jgi:hypothetical protein